MTEATIPRRRPRWWLLGVILILAAAVLCAIWFSELEPAFRIPFTLMTLMAAGVLILLWLVVLSGFRWRTRLAVLTGPVLFTGLALGTLRIEGCSGDMLPQLAWRWRPAVDRTLPEPVVAEDAPVDLQTTTPHDFPKFLGPEGRAVVRDVRLARDWSKEPTPRWRQPIGAGWSAFAIVGPFAVTQEQRGDFEQITCIELATGKTRWLHRDQGRFSELLGGDGPRATPTIVDGKVYTMGATGLLHCLDGATGKPIWTRDILKDAEMPNLPWAKSCSPLIFGNLVIVTLGDSVDRPLAAYDRKEGKPVWRAGKDKPSYATPVLTTLADQPQLVVVNAQSVCGHDPYDGTLLWEYQWPGEMAKCSQPVPVGDDRVYISAGYGMGSALLQIQGIGRGAMKVAALWKSHLMNTRFTNVVVREGFVYGLDNGILACQDLTDGKVKWKGERYGHGQVLLVDDLLLVVSESGRVTLIEASPEKPRELGRFQAIKGKTWNNPALSGPYLLVRNGEEAACYELPLSGNSP